MAKQTVTAADKKLAEALQGARKRARLTQADVATYFKIEPQAVSGWERGVSRPDLDKLVELAALYKTSIEAMFQRKGLGHRSRREAVPVVSPIAAGRWAERSSPFPVGEGEDTVRSDMNVSEHAYALKVSGRSMEKRFYDGDIIIVEPIDEVKLQIRDFVVAKLRDREETTFKQYWSDRAGIIELRALNDEEESYVIDKDHPGQIIGVMVEHHSYRRLK